MWQLSSGVGCGVVDVGVWVVDTGVGVVEVGGGGALLTTIRVVPTAQVKVVALSLPIVVPIAAIQPSLQVQ